MEALNMHILYLFESKFMTCFDLFSLLLVTILILTIPIPQDRRKSKHRYIEQGGTNNRPRTLLGGWPRGGRHVDHWARATVNKVHEH